MALSIIESRKISRQIRDNLAKVNAGGVSIIQSRSMSKAIKTDLALLNGTTVNTPENAFISTLKAIANGADDASTQGVKGLEALLQKIELAVDGLKDAGELTGEADAIAVAAIERWAKLEERQDA